MEAIGEHLAANLSADTDDRINALAGDTVPSPESTDGFRGNIEQLINNDAASETGETTNENVSSPPAAAAVAAPDASSSIPDPKSYRQQATSPTNPNRKHWKAVADAEINSHRTIGTWTLVKLPKGRKAIGCTWVFKTKRGRIGEILKYKARLCFRGDRQIHGIDYQLVFASTVKYQTLRTLLALAAYYDLEIEQFDVVTAFLNAELTDVEDVYMAQPDGYVKHDEDGTPYVCKLRRALYGLKQGPREWNQLLTARLVSYGFSQSLADPGCYTITVDGQLYVLCCYVDD